MSENLNVCYEIGRAVKGRIELAGKLSGGALFKSKHIVLGNEVLDICEAKEQSKDDANIRVVQNSINEYNLRKRACIE